MLPSRRLADLEDLIETNYQKLAKFQKKLNLTASVQIEIELEAEIPKIRKAIHDYETEYWDLLAQEAGSCAVEEYDAHNAMVKVVQEVELIENNPNPSYPDKLMQLLLEIRDKLNKPGQPAAAKLKAALPLVPGIVSYEVELDTESSLRRAVEPIKRLFRGALEKK